MRDANGFLREEGLAFLPMLVGVMLSTVTLFLYFFLFYEMSFERRYWVNRWKLYWHLRRGRVTKKSSRRLPDSLSHITECDLEIAGTTYHCWIYEDRNRMTFGTSDHDYIGLFCASPIMRFINTRSIKMIQSL